jgi:uncharacterized BrkB/YihY/UPF0761 family membrane protein
MKKLLPILLMAALLIVMAAGCTAEDAVGAGLSVFLVVCFGVLGLVGLFLFIVWIVALVDVAKRGNDEFPNATDNTKTIWLVVLIVTFVVGIGLSWIAAIVYYFMVMKKMPRKK